MSLINKMLRDLDRRNAAQGGLEAAAPGRLAEQVRPVSGWKVTPDFFWRTAMVVAFFALAWVGWLVWQGISLRPADAADPPALARAPREKTDAPSVAVAPPVIAEATAAVAEPKPAEPAVVPPAEVPKVAELAVVPPAQTPKVAEPAVVPPAQAPKAAEPAAPPPVDTAKIEKPKSDAAPTVRERAPRRASSRAQPKRPVRVARAAPARAVPAPIAPAEAIPTSEPEPSGKIDRRLNTTPRDRAENEFRRAVNLVNEGRVAEAMGGFRAALEIDPSHEAARKTLVALLLDARRLDEAAALLEQGLALNPENSGFVMLLARISVERGDIPGALALLQKHQPASRGPDFNAFAAALYQRLDRHKEAIERYRAALARAPGAGVWWVGLGISYQAVQQPKEAREAFVRAGATGNLSPDLSGFVQQRLKQLP